MANENNPNKQQLEIEVPKEEMQGRYTNLAVISHTGGEFFIDLIMRSPGAPKARVQARAVMTPESAKQLLIALQQNVQRYEMTFGEITPRTPGNGGNGPINFPIPKGQA